MTLAAQQKEICDTVIKQASGFMPLLAGITDQDNQNYLRQRFIEFYPTLKQLNFDQCVYILTNYPAFLHVISSAYYHLAVLCLIDLEVHDLDEEFIDNYKFPLSCINSGVLRELVDNHPSLLHLTIDESLTIPDNSYHYLLVLLTLSPQDCIGTSIDIFVSFFYFMQERLNIFKKNPNVISRKDFNFSLLFLLNSKWFCLVSVTPCQKKISDNYNTRKFF